MVRLASDANPVESKGPLTRRAAVAFGLGNLLTAALLGLGVFVALPARWWPVDMACAVLVALEVASAAGLLAGASWGAHAARAAAVVALGLGLLAVTLLAVTASWLSGVYGPVGRGGAIVLVLVAVLALPYLVVLPLVQLVALRPAKPASQVER
jgi:hypothetical protein